MARKSDFTMFDDQPLFTKESHVEFLSVEVQSRPEWDFFVAAYGLSRVGPVYRIKKKVKSSELYVVHADAQDYILRLFDASSADVVESQCEAITNISFQDIIRPQRSLSHRFVVVQNHRAAVFYPFVQGKPYDGDIRILADLVRKGLTLNRHLKKISHLRLPVVVHQPDEWYEFFQWILKSDRLFAPPFDAYVDEALASTTVHHFARLRSDIDEARDMVGERIRVAVHNDLNHANMLVQDRRCIIVDLEDIVLEVLEIAAAHLIFKLARHVVYMHRDKLVDVQDIVRHEIIPFVAEVGDVGPADIAAFRLFSLYRIASDIFSIIKYTLDMGDEQYLYDLNKKFENLLENEFIFKED